MKSNLFLGACLFALLPTAYADEAAVAATTAAQGGSTLSTFLVFGGMFVMMYFLMIRPQSKRAKEHRDLLASLTKGDEVVTQGGILGRIERDAGNFFIITLNDNVEVPVQKQSIVQMLPKGTLKSI